MLYPVPVWFITENIFDLSNPQRDFNLDGTGLYHFEWIFLHI